MAFPSSQYGAEARWSHIQNILDVLTGVTGGGDQVQLIQYNNSSNYALDVRNLDTTNGYGLRVRDGASANLLTVAKNAIGIGATATDILTVSAIARLNAMVYVNDTANANMTLGLTINQGANDDEALAIKSSDIAHGVTGVAETDTYFTITKNSAAVGEALLTGLGGGAAGIILRGINTSDQTAKTTAARAPVELRAYVKSGTGAVIPPTVDSNLVVIMGATTTRFIFDVEGSLHCIGATATDVVGNGLWFINDTANAKMTLGLTINQGANDDEALAIKSSDIAHGITDATETDTYFTITKNSATAGEALLTGLGGGAAGIILRGINTSDQTAKTTAARAPVELRAYVKSGTGAVIPPTVDSNLVVIMGATTTRFIFDVEGSGHQDVGTAWTEYDEYDDLALLDTLNHAVMAARDPIRHEFGQFLKYNRESLAAAKIVTFNDDGHHFINWSRANMLMIGALRQIGRRLEIAEQRLAVLPGGPG